MDTTDEAPGIHLVKATIPDLTVMGVAATTFYVTATGTADTAVEAVRKIVPADWILEASENRLTVATVRRLGLRPGEARPLT